MIASAFYFPLELAYTNNQAEENTGMSVVIIGGNERMECQYSDICKSYGHKAKIFTKENGSVKKKMGCPDLLILFTNTVSHKMAISASKEARRNNVPIAHVHSSSASALNELFASYAAN